MLTLGQMDFNVGWLFRASFWADLDLGWLEEMWGAPEVFWEPPKGLLWLFSP